MTGVGIVSPAGGDARASFDALLAGGRFVSRRTAPWGGSILAAIPDGYGVRPDRAGAMAHGAIQEALDAASLRVCCPVHMFIGISKPIEPPIDNTFKNQVHNVSRVCRRTASVLPPVPLRTITRLLDYCTSSAHCSVAACATGAFAVIRGAQAIADGDTDVAICVASDASIHPLWMAAYERMGVLAPAHPEFGPAWACRPFDRSRSGFVVGEGAAAIVLESGASARRRGVRALAQLHGWATATDPAGITQTSPDGASLAYAIDRACRMAGGGIAKVGCVVAHGTGTPANDAAEMRAIRTIAAARTADLPVVSIKGAIGHLLGAAGAVELAVAVLAVQAGRAPGNISLIEADPELGEVCLPMRAFQQRGWILKTSLGFGGHVAAVLVGPPDRP